MESDAHQRELLRLAEVRALRAARDEERRLAQLREADEAQRRPLILSLSRMLLQYQNRRSLLQAERDRQNARDAQWLDVGLTPLTALVWKGAGFDDAAAVARILQPLEGCADTSVTLHELLPDQVLELAPRILSAMPLDTGCLWASALVSAGLLDASNDLGDRLATFWLADAGEAVEVLRRGTPGTPWANWLLLRQTIQGSASLDALDIEHADLRLLDDLAERVPQTVGPVAAAAPESDRALYLRARSEPDQLSDAQVEALGWKQESERRKLSLYPDEIPGDPYLAACQRLLTGRGTAPDLAAVAEENDDPLLSDLQQFRGVSPQMITDPSCWFYVEGQLWSDPERSIDCLGVDPLAVWLSLRRVRHLLYQRELDRVLTEIRHALVVCHQHKQGQIELETARGLAEGLLGREKRARAALRRVTKLSGSALAERNLDAAETAKAPTRLSPFALLGVDHEQAEWEAAYDARYAEAWRTDPDLTIELNWAYDELSSGDPGVWVTYPLRPALYAPIPTRHGVFRPRARPLPRATPAVDETFRAQLRDLAWLELKTELVHALPDARTA